MNYNMSKTIIALICNIAIVIMEVIAAPICWANHGAAVFKFYTENSNFFAFFTCLIMAICQIKYLSSKIPIPKWAKMLKYMSVCCLTVTFVVVITILIPLEGGTKCIKPMLFESSSLYQHTLCPIIAFISFIFFEYKPTLPKKSPLYSMIPTLIYAAIVLTLNAIKVLDGPYPFVRVHNQSVFMTIVWCAVVLSGAYIFAFFIWKLNDQFGKTTSQSDEQESIA